MTALHFEKAETLLRAFRNVQLDDPDAASEVKYERTRAKQLVYQNMVLRREADSSGDVCNISSTISLRSRVSYSCSGLRAAGLIASTTRSNNRYRVCDLRNSLIAMFRATR